FLLDASPGSRIFGPAFWSCRPYGTQNSFAPYPALTCRAILCRPFGAKTPSRPPNVFPSVILCALCDPLRPLCLMRSIRENPRLFLRHFLYLPELQFHGS